MINRICFDYIRELERVLKDTPSERVSERKDSEPWYRLVERDGKVYREFYNDRK